MAIEDEDASLGVHHWSRRTSDRLTGRGPENDTLASNAFFFVTSGRVTRQGQQILFGPYFVMQWEAARTHGRWMSTPPHQYTERCRGRRAAAGSKPATSSSTDKSWTPPWLDCFHEMKILGQPETPLSSFRRLICIILRIQGTRHLTFGCACSSSEVVAAIFAHMFDASLINRLRQAKCQVEAVSRYSWASWIQGVCTMGGKVKTPWCVPLEPSFA